ncbi:Phage tail/DNA circulation protein [Desulfovibrio sp. DV]|uniref:DNA circularization protein n=1 Tax=Desulfovibrio sp. DV TaxID=1844708 RepID=UPI00094B9C4C|nr:DNA circularization N-terminal domain-containing protein [Desulfovibrio sp. DV]OLN30451.1 Phage tail/DNA circulation protein [Desulfovibrio sp. DV]
MAWSETLLPASFRGVPFDVISARDDTERAIVQHEYPYRDGAEIEDMGRRPRKVTLRAVFWGDDYEEAMADLIDALDTPGKGELIHPVFGSLTMACPSYQVEHHEDSPDYAEMELVFMEASPDIPFFARPATALAQAAGLAGEVESCLSLAGLASLAGYVSFAASLPGRVSAYVRGEVLGAIRSVTSVARTLASLPQVVAADVLAIPQALVSEARAVAGEVVAMAALPGAFGRFASLAAISDKLPRLSQTAAGKHTAYPLDAAVYAGGVVSGPLTGAAAPRPSVTLPATGTASAAASPELGTYQGQARAMAAAVCNLERATAMATAAGQVLAAEAAAPSLTPAEVETVVGSVRQRLQDCIDEHRLVLPTHLAFRVIEQVRGAALAVQELGATVIHLHPPLITHTAPSQCNLRLLAHWLYGDHTRAAELARLNPGLRNPNFVAQGQVLHGFAN